MILHSPPLVPAEMGQRQPIKPGNAMSERPQRHLLYHQVYNILSRQIINGTLQSGTFLPNEFELSREFHVSIGTIRKAIDRLVEERLVRRQQGKGTLIMDRRWSDVRNLSDRYRTGSCPELIEWHAQELEYRLMPADPDIAERLQLGTGDLIHFIYRVRKAKNSVALIEEICVPARELGYELLNSTERSSIIGLRQQRGLMLAKVDVWLSVTSATDEFAAVLDCQPMLPLLKITRLSYDSNNIPIEFRISHGASEDLSYHTSSSLLDAK